MPVTYTLKSTSTKNPSPARTHRGYTLVVETPSGVRNVFFDGLRCDTREIRPVPCTLENFGPIKKPKWGRAVLQTNAFAFAMRNYVCDPNFPTQRSRREISSTV